jgi:hypothetical protein
MSSRQKRWSSVRFRWAQAYSTLPFSAFGALAPPPAPSLAHAHLSRCFGRGGLP